MLLQPSTENVRGGMLILRDLPDLLQATLGLCGEANYLMGALTLAGISQAQILQHTCGGYSISVAQHGIDFMLRHVPQNADELASFPIQPTELWAVEGFALHLATWQGGLPGGLGAKANATQLLQAFAVPVGEAVQLPQMLCFEKAEHERRIGVIALLHAHKGQIESLIIKHQGDLTLATALPPWPSHE